ncbi:MAG: flagellar hook protein FlgE [Rhizobiaceae bacterium]
MSLYNLMRTSVSGMNAQANRLSTVADNIANSDTVGYKRKSIAFSTLVVPGTKAQYSSGSVVTSVREAIAMQGVLSYTSSITDLAIDGKGFFVVHDSSGTPYLTRAGSFVPDDEGRLVNAAGFYLTGYSYDNGIPSAVANGFEGLEMVSINNTDLAATPSTFGEFVANLPEAADIVTGDLPSSNLATAEFSEKSSLVVYDNFGGRVVLDIYFTKTADNTWEVSVYNQADAAPDTSFPYATGPMATQTLTFDPANGRLDAASASNIIFNVPDGSTVDIDMAEMTQLATSYLVTTTNVNGNPPAFIESVTISEDGILFASYDDGTLQPLYRIPLATVVSPDLLEGHSGNVYTQSPTSGDIHIGFANDGELGRIASGALEASNVDVADELTSMIQSQRSYTANSKVFQTGSDLMDVLVNLKR